MRFRIHWKHQNFYVLEKQIIQKPEPKPLECRQLEVMVLLLHHPGIRICSL